jgi:hypothetical protein
MHTDDSMRDYVSEQSTKGRSPKGGGHSFITKKSQFWKENGGVSRQ